MIVIDSSAILAVVLDEAEADACKAALGTDGRLLMSAVTLAEVLIVASGRNVAEVTAKLIEELAPEIVTVTEASAMKVAAVHRRWGKGVHPTGLNFGDCFAYALAKENECALAYVGNDFARTDVLSAL